tara:strand:- start:1618 stop:1896 length:279 start_codon:yes stop_codon:yes gene_type:complete
MQIATIVVMFIIAQLFIMSAVGTTLVVLSTIAITSDIISIMAIIVARAIVAIIESKDCDIIIARPLFYSEVFVGELFLVSFSCFWRRTLIYR